MKKSHFFAATLIAVSACSADKSNLPERAEAPATENSLKKEYSFNKLQPISLTGEQDKRADNILSSSAAIGGFSDSVHVFVRTANLKFKTKDVIHASFEIEDIIARQNGYVEHSKIQSEIRDAQEIKCSQDSAWKVTRFVTYNRLTVRVPAANLDQTLKSLRPLVNYLDYRIVNAENISFDMISNLLMQQRVSSHTAKMEQLPAKDQANTSDQLLERQIQSDNALIENLRIKDKVQISTIEIYIYQNEQIRKEKMPLFNEIEPYSPGFGTQLLESLYTGWMVIQGLFLLIVKGWSVLLLLLLGLIGWRRYRDGMSEK